MALRVPLRGMFPTVDAIEQCMGKIINAIPPQPDLSRPKLMNMKFELAPEAEGGFIPILPLRLDDGEDINVELVCKHTPWCDRCKWWNHTTTDGCPKLVQARDGQEAEVDTTDNFSQRNRQQLAPGAIGGIREAAKDPPVEILHQTVAESSIRAASRSQQPLRQGLSGRSQGIRIQSQQTQGQGAHAHPSTGTQAQAIQGGIPTSTGLHGRTVGTGFTPYRSNPPPAYYQGYGLGNPELQRFPGVWNTMGEQAWQSSILAATGILSIDLMGQHGATPQDMQAPLQGHVLEETRDLALVQIREREERWLEERLERHSMQERSPRGDGIPRTEGKELVAYTGGMEGGVQERGGSQELVEDVGMAGDENVEDSPQDIHDGAFSRTGDDQQMMDHLILPLVCTLQGHEIFVLGLRSAEGKLYMPTSPIMEIPSVQFVMMKVRQLFAERF
ncbi:hypothetical protein CBR_g26098 [Chara braunii]|uniref:Uncharacterized protein n=1 Tax=Chara braunii TaxID=69332 RepID=A0A388JVY0_CHABU|nr:hypothetical protein CBR_g26098 [Chara braunii]|eukprot:GBG61935.1 hypothetical protein CBR_g26098 [Chara braunii]